MTPTTRVPKTTLTSAATPSEGGPGSSTRRRAGAVGWLLTAAPVPPFGRSDGARSVGGAPGWTRRPPPREPGPHAGWRRRMRRSPPGLGGHPRQPARRPTQVPHRVRCPHRATGAGAYPAFSGVCHDQCDRPDQCRIHLSKAPNRRKDNRFMSDTQPRSRAKPVRPRRRGRWQVARTAARSATPNARDSGCLREGARSDLVPHATTRTA